MFKKKGQVAAVAGVTGLVSLAIVMVIYAVVSSYGAEIVGDTRDDFVDTTRAACGTNSTGGSSGTILYTGCDHEYNISQFALAGIAETAEKMPTVGRITVAAIIVTIILGAFGAFVALR